MKSLVKSIVYFFIVTVFLASASLAQAQNGNNNSGAGNGNGNSNGNITGNVGGASVNYRDRRQAPAVVAPGLAAAGIEACLGSVSLGGSGAGFGFSFGTTKLDQGCNIRLYARTLQAMGYRRAATQMLCYDAQVAGALATEGIRCQVGPTAAPQAGVAAMQQPAQRFARDSAPAASTDQPARRKCMRYDIFRGCLD
ncbi:hypothetical protein [Labrys neptuniae]